MESDIFCSREYVTIFVNELEWDKYVFEYIEWEYKIGREVDVEENQ